MAMQPHIKGCCHRTKHIVQQFIFNNQRQEKRGIQILGGLSKTVQRSKRKNVVNNKRRERE